MIALLVVMLLKKQKEDDDVLNGASFSKHYYPASGSPIQENKANMYDMASPSPKKKKKSPAKAMKCIHISAGGQPCKRHRLDGLKRCIIHTCPNCSSPKNSSVAVCPDCAKDNEVAQAKKSKAQPTSKAQLQSKPKRPSNEPDLAPPAFHGLTTF